MHQIFVYGTLKDGQPNDYLLTDKTNGNAKFVCKGYTDDLFPMVVATSSFVPMILFVKGKGKNIHGEVYDVDDAMLAALDDLEQHPIFYTREKTKIIRSKTGSDLPSSTECWCYFMKNFKQSLLERPWLDDYESNAAIGEYKPPYQRNADSLVEQVKE